MDQLKDALRDAIKIAIQFHLPYVSTLSARLQDAGGAEEILDKVNDLAMDMAIAKHLEKLTPEYARQMAEKLNGFAAIYAQACQNDANQILVQAVMNSFRLLGVQLMEAAKIL